MIISTCLPELGIDGAAYATIIGQFVSFALVMMKFIGKRKIAPIKEVVQV